MFSRQLLAVLILTLLQFVSGRAQTSVVQHWLILGPFPYQAGVAEPLDASGVDGEATLAPAAYENTAGRVWRPVQTLPNGKLDLLHAGLEQVDYVNTYAHVYVFSPQEREVDFAAGMNDGLQVWLNGKPVYRVPTGHGRAWRRGSRHFRVRLRAGWNRLLCKVSNLGKDYALSLEALDAPDLVFSTEGPRLSSGSGAWAVTWLAFDEKVHVRPDGKWAVPLHLEFARLPGRSGQSGWIKIQKTTRRGRHTLASVRLTSRTEFPTSHTVYVGLPDLLASVTGSGRLDLRAGASEKTRAVRSLSLPAEAVLSRLFIRPLAVDLWEVEDVTDPSSIRSSQVSEFVRQHLTGAGAAARLLRVPLRFPEFLRGFPLGVSLPTPAVEVQAFFDGEPMETWDRDGKDVRAWKAVPGGSRQAHSLQVALAGMGLDAAEIGWPELRLLAPAFSDFRNNARLGSQVAGRRFFPGPQEYRHWVDALLAGGRSAFDALVQAETASVVQACQPFRADTLHFIGNSHIDLQWMWRWHETVNVCKATFGQALRFMDEYPDFKYAQSQAQAYVWMEEFAPEIFEKIRAAVQRGQWIVVGDSWCEPDANIPSGESHVRQILYGKRYFRKKLGTESRIAWLPDTFGFPATLPQIFKHCGLDYFATQKLRFRFDVPFPYDVFWWKSPDGSRVLSFMTYGYDVRLHEVPSIYRTFKAKTGLDNLLLLYGVGDHGGGPSRKMIRTIHEMERAHAFPVVDHLRPDSAMARLERHSDRIPTWQDELYLQYHRGTYTSQSELKRTNRRLEVLFGEAEVFNALSPSPRSQWEIEKAWRKLLLEQFHDVLAGSSIPGVYEDAFANLQVADFWAHAVLDSALTALEEKIDTRGKGVPVVVWNALCWPRTDVARLDLPAGFEPAKVRVVDARGREVPSQVSEGQIVWLAERVPAFGYRVYWLQAKSRKSGEAVTATEFVAANGRVKIEFDPDRGTVKNLWLRTERGLEPVLAPEQAGNDLLFLGDRGNAWNLQYTGETWRPEQAEVRLLERGPVFARFRVTRRFRDSRFLQDFFVYKKLDRVDVRTTVDWHARHVTAKAVFPLAFRAETAVFDEPYGVIERPTVPKTAIDSTKFEVSGQKWVDLSAADGSLGLALLDNGKYGYDIRPDRLRLTLLRSATSPDPEMDQGTHVFTYALLPHRGDWRAALVPKQALALNTPLICRVVLPHRGELPASHGWIRLSPESVRLAVVKRPEEGDGLILRVVELIGKSTSVEISLPWKFRRAWFTNALEDVNLGSVEVEGSNVRFSLRPFQLATIRLE